MSDIKKKNEETSTSDGNKTVFWSTHIAILHDCMFELQQQLKLHSQKTKRSDHLAGLVKVAYQCLSSRFVQALCYLHFFTRSLNFNTSHCCCLNSINFVSSSTPRSDIEVVGASVFFFRATQNPTSSHVLNATGIFLLHCWHLAFSTSVVIHSFNPSLLNSECQSLCYRIKYH